MTLLDALNLAAQYAARHGGRFFVAITPDRGHQVFGYRPGNCKIVAVVLPCDAA